MKHPSVMLNMISRTTTSSVVVTCEEHHRSTHRNLINFRVGLQEKNYFALRIKRKIRIASHTQGSLMFQLWYYFFFLFPI